MNIDFSSERWDALKANYRLWWEGKLDRPILPVYISGRDPGRPEPSAPTLSQANVHDMSITPEEIIDRLDYDLSSRWYLGDAFPFVNMDAFGPGVIAAFLGCRLDNSTGQVWFYPPDDKPIAEIHLEYKPDSVWLRRVQDIYRCGMERWQGNVLMGMADLGGAMDILASFRPGEKLLFDLIESPEEVSRLVGEIHLIWHRYFEELNAILQPVNPGYSTWAGIYSETPTYMLQSDFSYMIGPDMFNEFALPEIAMNCEKLDHPFFHLDGVGMIPHLDSLLNIPRLKGVQWVPGDGQSGCECWPHIYQKIHAAGKRIQLIHSRFEVLDALKEQIGDLSGVQMFGMTVPQDKEAHVREQLAKYGLEYSR